ncbi:MAG: efflux RND transporter permease subunit [Eubacteriales bacterium]|nr:efflux RND transporter permease subunit [Eubacteriales bacterium]
MFALFIAASLFSAWAMRFVNVNYDIVKYLPADSATSAAFNVMEDQFGNIGYAQMIVSGVTADEANLMSDKIKSIDGVDSVLFDAGDETSFREGCALFKIYLKNSDFTTEASQTLKNVEALFPGMNTAFSGYAAESGFIRDSVKRDCAVIFAMAAVVVFLILMLTSRSWADPLVFVIGVSAALVINLGSNALFDEISFISSSICAVLQLALAMDYSIIILHRYDEERGKTENKYAAMEKALAGCFTSVSAASLTTIAGLAAIMCMKFRIGLDIGAVLTKGIICSLLMSFFFLPCIILMFDRLLEKTRHKAIIPRINKIAAFSYKTRKVIPAAALIIFIICGIVQTRMPFIYDIEIDKDSEVFMERTEIYDAFGPQNPLIVLVPKGDTIKEKKVIEYIKNLKHEGKNIISYGTGLAVTELYNSYNIKEAAERFSIPESMLKPVYKALDSVDGRIVVCDLLDYMVKSDYITVLAGNTQDKIDYLHTAIKEADGDFDAERISELFGISEAEAYAAIYNAEGNLFGNKTLFVYEAIKEAYLLTGDQALEEYNSLAAQVTDEYSATDILSDSTMSFVFDENEVRSLFADYSLNPETDKLNGYKILAYVCENKLIIKKHGALYSSYQATYDKYYAEAAKLFEGVTVEEAALLFGIPDNQAFAVFCAAYPEDTGDFKTTLNKITLSKDDIKTLFGIDAAYTDDLFAVYGCVDYIPVETLINFAYENRIAEVIGAEKEETLDKIQSEAVYAVGKLEGTEYSRLIFNIASPVVSDGADYVVETLRSNLGGYYDEYYILGSSVNIYDVRDTFSSDVTAVNIISILAIFIIVLISFGSISIPAALVAAIEGAIFVNLTIDTVTNTPVYFVCYLIAICIQMGATIDYAILLTDRYVCYRATMNIKDSIRKALNVSMPTILSSGLILIIAAGLVWFIATVPMISSIGKLISKGAMVSVLTVIFILPQTLCLLDRVIEKFSFNKKFYREQQK